MRKGFPADPSLPVAVSHPLRRSTFLRHLETQPCLPMLISYTLHGSKPALRCPAPRKTEESTVFPEILGPAPLESAAFSSPCVSPCAGTSARQGVYPVWKRFPCSKMQLAGGEGPIGSELHSCLQSRGRTALGCPQLTPIRWI